MMFNIKKFNTLTAALAVLTAIYTAPTLSKEFINATTSKQVAADFNKQVDCLEKNIYYEAGTQGKEGMEAVAQVTLNRKRAGFAPSLCGVVHQEGCQFTWTCEPYKQPIPSLFAQAYEIAKKSFMTGVALARLDHALYFHGDYIKPDWASQKKFIEQIGQHRFYGEYHGNERREK